MKKKLSHSSLSTAHCLLSVVLATKNEEANIGACLQSVKAIADEIIVFDEYSTDKTREIAKKSGAKVFKYKHKTNFHETKQRAINRATGDWILQLDADERVTPKLAKEIESVIEECHSEFISESMDSKEILIRSRLFLRHQRLIANRYSGQKKAFYNQVVYPERSRRVAFFIPRLNYFLGAPLRHAGVYPDGVIRLFKKGKAWLPGKSVHELMEVDGEVGWLFNNLEHHDSPTFSRYLDRANRYTDLTAKVYEKNHLPANLYYLFLYTVHRPLSTFLKLYFRHRGYKDGFRGFVWSLFSALHFPLAYMKYYSLMKTHKPSVILA